MGMSDSWTRLTWKRREPLELSGKDKIVDPAKYLQTTPWYEALPVF